MMPFDKCSQMDLLVLHFDSWREGVVIEYVLLISTYWEGGGINPNAPSLAWEKHRTLEAKGPFLTFGHCLLSHGLKNDKNWF